jgi:hypothetical protein
MISSWMRAKDAHWIIRSWSNDGSKKQMLSAIDPDNFISVRP